MNCLELFVKGLLSKTVGEVWGECRPTTWFIGGIVALVSFIQFKVYNNTTTVLVWWPPSCAKCPQPDHHGGGHLVNLHLHHHVGHKIIFPTQIITVFYWSDHHWFFRQIITVFYSADHHCGGHRPLQLPLLRLLPSLPPRQMPEAKWKCLKCFIELLDLLFRNQLCAWNN